MLSFVGSLSYSDILDDNVKGRSKKNVMPQGQSGSGAPWMHSSTEHLHTQQAYMGDQCRCFQQDITAEAQESRHLFHTLSGKEYVPQCRDHSIRLFHQFGKIKDTDRIGQRAYQQEQCFKQRF